MLVSISMFAMTSAPALAETNVAVSVAPARKTVDLVCMVAAVDAREAALQGGLNTFSGAQLAALTTRANALHSAWGMTDVKARRTAIRAAWSVYRTTHRTAVNAHRTAHNAAWGTFRTASKTCHGNSYEEGGSAADSNLNS